MSKLHYFDDDLKKRLENPTYKKLFEEQLRKLRIGVKIAKIRQKWGWSQAQLARRAHTSQQAISRIEDANYTKFALSTLQKIADALGKHLVIDFK